MDFLIQMVGSRPVEIIAVLCGLANVTLIIRRSIWNYPFGFVMVVLYAFIFYEYQLYSDALLQVYFFFMQIYGLANWSQNRTGDGPIVVETLPGRSFALHLAVTAVGWLVLSGLMARYTDASYPFWDGAIAALSVLAQYMLARRWLESWFLWITVDVLAIGLFITKDLAPTAALYGVFLILAIIGLIQRQKASETTPA